MRMPTGESDIVNEKVSSGIFPWMSHKSPLLYSVNALTVAGIGSGGYMRRDKKKTRLVGTCVAYQIRRVCRLTL